MIDIILKYTMDILQLVTLVWAVYQISGQAKAQSPNAIQDERLLKLEIWKEDVDRRLETGNAHFTSIDEGNKVTQQSLLAIMDTLINGDAKEELKRQRTNLYNYLTNGKE